MIRAGGAGTAAGLPLPHLPAMATSTSYLAAAWAHAILRAWGAV